MGQMLEMNCPCGYVAGITIGGNKRNHATVCMFPHFCEHCGVVNANQLAEPRCCPKCKNPDILIYGEMAVTSEFTLFGIRLRKFDKIHWAHDERVTQPAGNDYESWGHLRLPIRNHLCPSCQNMTLSVSIKSICFFD